MALVKKKYILCITYDILLEYEEVITRHASPELASAVTDALLDIPNVELITRYFAWNMITSDPDDNKFVDCTIAARAQFLVSEDRHFNALREVEFPKVNVVGIQTFQQVILKGV